MRIDRKLFIEVFRNQASTHNRYAQRKFASWILSKCKMYDRTCKHEFDKEGNLYITKGKAELYPCIVGHLDQIHRMVDDYSIIVHKDYAFAMDNTMMRQTGIGGDDKCAVYIALEMFQRFDNIKLAFFVDEECGGVGSFKANLEFFNDCCFVIQPDRNHAKNDYINYTNGISVTSDEFDKSIQPILDRYMYSEAFGTFTDIGVLKENGLDICAFNIACGYLFAHSSDEVVHIPSLELCMDVVFETISTLSYKRWEHLSESKYKSGWDFDWERYYQRELDKEFEEDDVYMDEALNSCNKKWCNKKNFAVDLDGGIYCHGCNDYIKEPNDIYGKLDTGII